MSDSETKVRSIVIAYFPMFIATLSLVTSIYNGYLNNRFVDLIQRNLGRAEYMRTCKDVIDAYFQVKFRASVVSRNRDNASAAKTSSETTSSAMTSEQIEAAQAVARLGALGTYLANLRDEFGAGALHGIVGGGGQGRQRGTADAACRARQTVRAGRPDFCKPQRRLREVGAGPTDVITPAARCGFRPSALRRTTDPLNDRHPGLKRHGTRRDMADTNFDIIIIGAGPGGYVTAIRAAQLGFKVAVVERDFLGGICSNWGCIPTKALLRSADVYHLMQNAKEFGLKADNISFDPAAVVKRSRAVAARMNSGVGFLFRKNKITLIWGEATIDAPGKVSVKASKTEAPKGALGPGAYQAKHIIVATGARPRVLPGLEPDKKLVWTYFEAMAPDRMPKSLLVIGSGAIGVEFASFYRTMGAEVTIVEVLPQILPVEDAEISAFARKAFEKQGIKIFSGAKVTKLDKKGDSVTATIDDGKGGIQSLTVDRVIAAVGVVGNVENLGLEKVGVKIDRGAVVVDNLSRTSVPGIYAIGDVAGPPLLAHKAEHEGVDLRRGDQGPASASDEQGADPRLHLLLAADRLGRADRAGRQGQEARHSRRPVPVRRQRQGDRARRGSGSGQGHLRQEDRPAPRRPHGRRGSHRADPGLCGRDEPRDHRGRADAHDLPAPDDIGNDEGSGAGRVWAGAERLRARSHSRRGSDLVRYHLKRTAPRAITSVLVKRVR